ncbi:hypothetical protein [Methylomagnum ishizawai]|uniref:hypothetical protein n=1 Tax=Methylomagnum ishizawai TaxID=1760988 RepID=UPI001C3326D7|nr:hypothetical protein [Methylomagnum ishizawai]BBL74208.1 hypothetical protein MishRS11D_13060 [Methylomagnum ishizawai]
MLKLKKALFDAYGGFGDKRIKNLDKGSTFVVDDRSSGDYGADKNLFLWFCSIFVEVISDAEVKVSLCGGVPISPSVETWAKANGAKLETSPGGQLVFHIKKGEQPALLSLADAIQGIVAPGNKYPVAAYKYVCPRTANSLSRLANELSAAWIA